MATRKKTSSATRKKKKKPVTRGSKTGTRKKAAKPKARKKTAARKTAGGAKKAARRKTSAKKKATRKGTARKKVTAKKKVAKKKAAKKTPARKKTAKKPAARKKSTRKKAATKKTASKTNRKPAAKKTRPARKRASLKSAGATKPRKGYVPLSGPVPGIEPYHAKKNEQYMNEPQREHFRAILRAWKAELMQEVDRTVHHMKDEAANFPDPNDRATQESEFSLELRTRDRERKLIKKIDEAAATIDSGDYGYCESCGVEIGVRRLEARPTATQCIDCKTLDEIREKQMRA